ncbi:MAG: hypothetical protein AABY45_09670 [Deltaproteobacteria bacterium]|jgi:hypothetical protein
MGKRWLVIIAAFALLAVVSCGKKAPPQPLDESSAALVEKGQQAFKS